MKNLILASLILFSSVSAYAAPDSTDAVLKAVAASPELAEVLAANEGFKSIKLNVLWGNEIPEGVAGLCNESSRSASYIQVELEMKTFPVHSHRKFYFSTPESAANVMSKWVW